jgi:L-arabinose isomerase
MNYPLRVGLMTIGLSAYWPQFAGLEDRLMGYNRRIAEMLQVEGAGIVNLGMVDSVEKGVEAGHALRVHDVDILFLHIGTYALSSTVLPAVRRAKVPIVVLNLAPEAAINYVSFNRLKNRTEMTGEWLAHCGSCPVPEIANVFRRVGVPFFEVTGMIDDDAVAWDEMLDWTHAARVANVLQHNRMGLMGHYYSGMLDIATDLTRLCGVFGCQVEMLEVDELSGLRLAVNDAEIKRQVEEFRQLFDIQPDCDPRELDRAAATAVGLDRLASGYGLNSLAYYYQGTGNVANKDTMDTIILGTSLLSARNIPVAGEYEVKNSVAMKIMDSFGVGGSFTEFYAVDFNTDEVLMGHDGPGHLAIAEGRVKVRPLREYHGKTGQGLSIEMQVKHGPITMLSVVEDAQYGYKLLMAEGASVEGSVLEIGNTNSHYRFSLGAREFMHQWNSHGPAHHCAVGVGHIAGKLEKLGALLGIPAVRVC